MAALSFRGVAYAYPGAEWPALDGVTLDVEAGELVLLVGESGCGKTTLLRAAAGLVPTFHGGTLHGRVVVDGIDTRYARVAEIAARAGLVFQDPEAQLVMQRPLREAAFGLENLGHPGRDIPLRAEEALLVTGASRLAERDTGQLSGGEKQRVAIASVLAMGQRILLLDEPTSQLDPVAAEELLGLLGRLARDRGITVVVAEHRSGRLFADADRVVVMDTGHIVCAAAPEHAARVLAASAPELLPPVAQAFLRAGRPELPLSVREARRAAAPAPVHKPPHVAGSEDVALRVRDAWKRLGETWALRGADAAFPAGRVTALVGENGAGKTTLALVAAGLTQADRGSVERRGRAGYVSQDPAHYLVHDSVQEELAYGAHNVGLRGAALEERVRELLAQLELEALAGRHPRDLSSGERQRVAIAAVLSTRPAALLLDEPTRGLDGRRKAALAGLVRRLAGGGASVAVVTHDIDFAAECADCVTALARGRTLVDGRDASVLAGTSFFASQVGLATGRPSIAAAAAALRPPASVGLHA
jgi:energy-coupling factor transport system ATP-binding protein